MNCSIHPTTRPTVNIVIPDAIHPEMNKDAWLSFYVTLTTASLSQIICRKTFILLQSGSLQLRRFPPAMRTG